MKANKIRMAQMTPGRMRAIYFMRMELHEKYPLEDWQPIKIRKYKYFIQIFDKLNRLMKI